MKIYTKTGDDGTTGLQGGTRVLKSNPRIMSYGSVDEANATIGVALSFGLDEEISVILTSLQNELFVVGADLSNPTSDTKNRVTTQMIENLEKTIDGLEERLEPLSNFILPGGDVAASQIHLARAVIRRAEAYAVLAAQTENINENCIRYLNRLSDLLFVLARTDNKKKGKKDVMWKP
jgi:cob(I)alamin adenosyltransferase